MIKKLANAIEMSSRATPEEQAIANKTSKAFSQVLSKMEDASNHLDVIYNPFKKTESVSSELIHSKRGLFNRFRKACKENYEELKLQSFIAVSLFEKFDSDSQVKEIIKSFDQSMKDIEVQVENLLKLLQDGTSSPTFQENLITLVEDIKKQSIQLKKLVEDRVIEFLDANILAKSWKPDVDQNESNQDLNKILEEKVPYIIQLQNERRKALAD